MFVDGLFGYPDNASTGSDGLIWLAIPSRAVSILAVIQNLPRPLRWALDKLPETKATSMTAEVGVVACDSTGSIVHEYVGQIPGFASLTGVRELAGTLYFSSLTTDGVATARVR